MNEFVLTRDQIMKLAKIVVQFEDTKFFTLYQTNDNGIGPSTHVRFALLEENDTQMNITDVSTW